MGFFSKILLPVITVLIAGILFAAFIYYEGETATASSSDNLSGWAWSETIGWISFNCTNTNSCGSSNYGVNVQNGGNMEGYAWSEHIGWISFNNNDVNGCPQSPCRPKMDQNTGEVSGWAKALAASGGWDGWIHLRGSNYGVNVVGNEWQGWAWGGDVVGWINFKGVNYGVVGTGNAALMDISCSGAPATVFAGDTVTWTASVNGGQPPYTYTWSGDEPLEGRTGNPVEVVYNTIGTKRGKVRVQDTGGGNKQVDCGNTVEVNAGILSFTATPSSINPGEESTLAWDTAGFTSCSINNGVGSVPVDGSTLVAPTVTTTYTLSCTGSGGDDSAEATVTVSEIPFFQEITPE